MFWEKELSVTKTQEMPDPEGPAVGPATRGRCGHSHCQTLDKAKKDLGRAEGILPSFTSPAPGLLLVNSSWKSHFQIWKQKHVTILRRSLAKKKKNPGKVVKMSIILMGNKTQLQPIRCSCQDIAKMLTWKCLTEAVPMKKAVRFCLAMKLWNEFKDKELSQVS